MTHFKEAVLQLTCVLESENAALQRMDLTASSALLAAKHEALARLQAAASDLASPSKDNAELRLLSERLSHAAQDNKRLLERAMNAQRSVMALMARAINQKSVRRCYGSKGLVIHSRPDAAFALSASA